MSKHAAGPWSYAARLSASENHKGFALWPATGGSIAEIYPLDQDGRQGEANARLIAAAPDLLAALRDAVDVMERSQPHEGGYTWQRLERARAAIASVEGSDK